METIDCETSLYVLLSRLIKSTFPSIISKASCSCVPKTSHFALVEIRYDDLAKYGINNLDKCVIDKFTACEHSDLCSTCHSLRSTTNRLGEILWFNVTFRQNQMKTPIQNIQAEIFLQEQHFELKGIIEYVPGQVGHFIAHCKRPDGKFYMYNDQLPCITESPDSVLTDTLIYTKK